MPKSCLPARLEYRRPVLQSAGKGFRFVRVGELKRPGDEFYTASGKWVAATTVWSAVAAKHRHCFRRRVEA